MIDSKLSQNGVHCFGSPLNVIKVAIVALVFPRFGFGGSLDAAYRWFQFIFKIGTIISVGGGGQGGCSPPVGKTLVSFGQFFQKDIIGKATV